MTILQDLYRVGLLVKLAVLPTVPSGKAATNDGSDTLGNAIEGRGNERDHGSVHLGKRVCGRCIRGLIPIKLCSGSATTGEESKDNATNSNAHADEQHGKEDAVDVMGWSQTGLHAATRNHGSGKGVSGAWGAHRLWKERVANSKQHLNGDTPGRRCLTQTCAPSAGKVFVGCDHTLTGVMAQTLISTGLEMP